MVAPKEEGDSLCTSYGAPLMAKNYIFKPNQGKKLILTTKGGCMVVQQGEEEGIIHLKDSILHDI